MSENLAFGVLTLLLSVFLLFKREEIAASWSRRLRFLHGPEGPRRAEWAVLAVSLYMLAVSAYAFVSAWRGR